MLSLQRLFVLKAVGERGSFTGAAEELHYSQSAVSQQIAALESEVGVPLVQRLPRGTRLTPAGRLLYERAVRILREAHHAERELAALAGVEGGELRVAAFQTAAAALLPAAVSAFRAKHAAVELHFRELEAPECLAGIESGDLDVAVVMDYPEDALRISPAVVVERIAEEPFFVAVGRSHPAARRRGRAARARLADFSDAPWIGGAACTVTLTAGTGFRPRVVFESNDYGTVQGMVAAGFGVAMLPALATLNLHPGVVAIPIDAPAARRRIYTMTAAGDSVLPAARAMVAELRAHAPRVVADLLGTTPPPRPRKSTPPRHS